ncbi:MAG: DUF5916 domain-containing protein [Gemmatimonadota bacterium]
MLSVLLTVALLQEGSASGRPPGSAPHAAANRVTALRAVRPPVIDGRDDEEIWRGASPITAFKEFDPIEGKDPRYRTEAKVAYDDHNIYVFARMFDPEPKKVLRLLARRDVRAATDQVIVIIDSYHDRRSGYEFAVSPGGVKRDYSIYNDTNEDSAWDGVWDVATTVDSLGWTAEFRIPLSQMRYGAAESHTFGFGVWRDIDRYKERVSWPQIHRNVAGLASQLGEIAGIDGISSPRRLEVTPYAVTKNVTRPAGSGSSHPQLVSGGVDLKYGVSSNLTLDGTVNPDFGQVEADPAQLNLSAVETYFGERRPFFIEGSGLLRFNINCYAVRDCGSENLFYSRRIGRAPQLADSYGDASSPAGTSILGAAKLTGRTPGGFSLGMLEAVTGREEGTLGRTIEPRTSYTVIRATQDFRRGASGIGVIGTLVDRSLDPWTRSDLRSSALVGGFDLRHKFANNRFEVSGQVVASRVTGTADAIAATQTSPVHYFQRPGSGLGFDPTRTSLGGDAGQLRVGKIGGGLLRFETSYQRVSPGFEANDLGFLRRADWQAHATWAQLAFTRPALFYRQLFLNFNEWNEWTTGGLPLDRGISTNVHVALRNNWWIHGGFGLGGLGSLYCDACARGGPAVRTDGYTSQWLGIEGDGRRVVVPGLWLNYNRRDGGRSRYAGISPYVQFRVASRWSSSLGVDMSWNRDDRQWYNNFTDGAGLIRYTFGHLEQRTASVTARVDFTASPNLTMQLYAQPFISKGRFSNVRDYANPTADRYDDRYRPYDDPAVTADPQQFNVKAFRSNAVLRWEYRPGSALFLVWQHGRSDDETQYGNRSFGGDLGQLFHSPADNTFLIKISYWLDR